MDRTKKYAFDMAPITFLDPVKDADRISYDRFATLIDKDTWCRQNNLWKSDTADMEVVVGNTVFKVHKTLLAISSGYFNKKLAKVRPTEGMHREVFPTTSFRPWEIEVCLKDAYRLFSCVDEHVTAVTAPVDFARLVYCADFLEHTAMSFDAPGYFLTSLKNPALADNPGVVVDTIKAVYSGVGGRNYLGKMMAKMLKVQGLLKPGPELLSLFTKFPQLAIDLATVYLMEEYEEETTSSDTSSKPSDSKQGEKGDKGENVKKDVKVEKVGKGVKVEESEKGEKTKGGSQEQKGQKAKKGGS